MQKIIKAKPLAKGAHIRVIAPSCSGKTIKLSRLKTATQVLTGAGFKISLSKNFFVMNEFESSDPALRIKDLHQAFADPNVDGILAVRGGFNANDLLDYIDWQIIKNNPKVYCGYSDNTVLENAILAKTGLVTYSGPNFSTFGNPKGLKYTLNSFLNAISDNFAVPIKNLNKFEVINKGKASGRIIGGNLCTLNLLQGTQYMPDIAGGILFFEDDHVSSIDRLEFMRNLQSVINLPGFEKIRGIVFGRFEKESKLSSKTIAKIVKSKSELLGVPVVANATFGHRLPIFTFPIGGTVIMDTNKNELEVKV